MALVSLGQLAQGRPEDLTGLADKRGSVHDGLAIGEGAGNANAHRTGATEQRALVRAVGVALDQDLALEGVALGGVSADVIQISVAAEDFAVPEHDHAAALAGPAVLQAD